MHLLVLFAIPKSVFIRQDRLNRLKQRRNLYMFRKVYLQYGIAVQRLVTRKGLPSDQCSRMMILKIEFAKNKCLSTIWFSKKIPVAWTYPTREHYKNANFL